MYCCEKSALRRGTNLRLPDHNTGYKSDALSLSYKVSWYLGQKIRGSFAKHLAREYWEKTEPSQIFMPCNLSSCRVSVCHKLAEQLWCLWADYRGVTKYNSATWKLIFSGFISMMFYAFNFSCCTLISFLRFLLQWAVMVMDKQSLGSGWCVRVISWDCVRDLVRNVATLIMLMNSTL